MFLKLMDANADTIETHFALGTLYRRRGEVERAIRIHQNLLARDALAPEHREQALLALAQDYLRAGVLDRAEGLFSRSAKCRACARARSMQLRLVYERQHEWQQALGAYRQLSKIKAAPARRCRPLPVRAGGAVDRARRHGRCTPQLRDARSEAAPFPRRRCCGRGSPSATHSRNWRSACCARRWPKRRPCSKRNCRPAGIGGAGRARHGARRAGRPGTVAGFRGLKRLVFAAISADLVGPRRCALRSRKVFSQDDALQGIWHDDPAQYERIAREIGTLLPMPKNSAATNAGFRAAIFIGIARHAMPGTASRRTPSSNFVSVRFVRRAAP